jgi:hypothetical protein
MEEHMTIAAVSANPGPNRSLWSRLAAAPLHWALSRRYTETEVADADRNSEAGGVVGAKKRAVFVDRRGRLRIIELFLPTDVLADMRQPIEIRFLEGKEDLQFEQFKNGISNNFHGFSKYVTTL